MKSVEECDRAHWVGCLMCAMKMGNDKYVSEWSRDFIKHTGPGKWTAAMTKIFPLMQDVLDEY